MTADIRAKVRAALPSASLALMDIIEAHANQEIAFELNPNPQDHRYSDPFAVEVSLSEMGATILSYDFENIDARAVTHELLHIHRCWVEGTPLLLPISTEVANLKYYADIDNDLEHLVIVPREKDYGFDSRAFWNATAKAFWDNYPWPKVTRPQGRRNNALIARLGLELVSDKEIWALANKLLGSEGWAFEAQKFADRIEKVLHDKARTVSCVVRFLKLPRDHLRLTYLDVRSRSRRDCHIPVH